MVPVPNDSVDLENLDSEVPEDQDRNDSDIQPGKQVSDSCSSKQHDSVTSRQPRKNESETKDSESTTQQQTSSRHRYAGKNRSSYYSEKRHDHEWRDERYSHRVDNRRQKQPSDTSAKDPALIAGTSDEVINADNGTAVVSEPLTETANHHSSKDYSADLAKPAMPSGHTQNSGTNRNSNYYARSRNRFYDAYSRYGDDRDLDSRHYKDRRRVRRPTSAKTTAGTVCNDDDFDEELDDSDCDHAASSSAVSAESNSAVESGSKQNNSRFGDGPHRRRNNGYHGYQNTRARPASAPKADSTLPSTAPNLEQRQNTGNNAEVKPRPQNHRPRKYWNRRVSDKASRSSVGNDEEVQKTTDAAGHASVEVSKCDDVQRECDAVGLTKDESSTSAEQKLVKQADAHQVSTDGGGQGVKSHARRNNRTRHGAGGSGHFDKESASRDDRQHGQDRAGGSSSYAEKESYQRNRGGRSGASRNFRSETQPSNNLAGGSGHFESASRDDRQHGQDRADGGSSYAERESYQRNRGGRSGAGRNFRQGTQPSDNRAGGSGHFDKELATSDDRQHGQDRADGNSSYAEKESYQRNRGGRSGASRNLHREFRPSSNHRHCDNQSVYVDSQTEVPSAKCHENEFSSRPRPPRFCVQHRPTSATAQLPTS